MRIDYIDTAKAILIVLVVLGHTVGIPSSLKTLIYSFHMPAFVFISGYLLKDEKLHMPLIKFLKSQLATLIYPYVFFGTISILYAIPNLIVKRNEINIYKIFTGFLYGNSDGLVNISLWYFTCLFSTTTLFFLLQKKFKLLNIVIISIIIGLFLCFFSKYTKLRPPWNIDLAIISLFFLSYGKYCSRFNDNFIINKESKKTTKILAGLLILTILPFLSTLNGRIDMAFMNFNNPILFYTNAILGTTLLFIASTSIPRNTLISYLARNTILMVLRRLMWN